MKVILKTIKQGDLEVNLFYDKLDSLILRQEKHGMRLLINNDYNVCVTGNVSVTSYDRCRLIYTPCESEKSVYRADVRDLLVIYNDINEMLFTFATDPCQNDWLNITINLDTDSIAMEHSSSEREVYRHVEMYIDRILSNEDENSDTYGELKMTELSKLRKK